MKTEQVALFAGGVALALIIGALFFQYVLDYPPCEMCHWQRWPHIAAATLGIGGWFLLQRRVLQAPAALPLAILTLLLIVTSGMIGVFHAGVEWQWWPGPSACTTGYVFTGKLDLNAPVPRCDVAAWRLFGISMAGYNAVISLGAAALGAVLLVRKS
ncbi:MAG TPA: disulfide bond formation protein B [Rhizomicrobium sp.]|nr:disulfide bond formation protein B [Rhizomicrobium sp.]